MRALAVLLLLLLPSTARAEETRDAEGAALYRGHCAECHEGGVERAPDAAALRLLPVARIKAALTGGSMSEQGKSLGAAEIDAVSGFLGSSEGIAASAGATCAETRPPPVDAFAEPHWNGWGVDAEQHRFQPAAMAQLAAEDVPRLRLAWAFGFAGVNRADAQPTIVGGRLFVGSGNGKVYSLDAKTGCVIWVFEAGARVRTAISIGIDARGWSAYFGDQRAIAFALDALSGALRWKIHVDEHPAAVITGAPSLADRVLYVPVTSYEEVTGADPHYACCSFRGSIVALDAATGKVLWKTYSIAEAPKPVRANELGVQLLGPSGAGIWSSPTIDRAGGMIYATTGDSYSDPAAVTSDAILAFRLDSGALAWARQVTAGDAFTVACVRKAPGTGNCPEAGGPDLDFGSSPILVQLANGKRALIAGQKSGVVHAIDPDRQGAILWQRRIGTGGTGGGVKFGSAVDEHNVYVALSDVRMRQVPPTTPGAQPSVFGPSFLLDPAAGGGLFALAIESGEVVWHTPHPGCGDAPGCSPAQSAAVTASPGVVFSGGLDGHLRAYAAETGRIIWDVDTVGIHKTVNGMTALGGSLDGPGAVVVGGMVYVNSGYAYRGGLPGNVLLAFSVGGRARSP
jgi:polyvinyl alcohol dehydrogenase (cytochrome)